MEYIAHIDEKDKKRIQTVKKSFGRNGKTFRRICGKIWERRLGLL